MNEVINEFLKVYSTEIVAGVTFGLLVSILGEFAKHVGRKKQTKENNLECKIKELTSALSESAHLIDNIQGEIDKRHKLVTKLKEDHEHFENLIKLKESEIEAVAQLLRGELQKEGKNSFLKGVIVNLIFFVLGSGVSLVITFYN